MNIPVIIRHKTRTGLAVKYPMGRIEEVILSEGMKLIGTCGECRYWVGASFINKMDGVDFICGHPRMQEICDRFGENDGCRHWKEKER